MSSSSSSATVAVEKATSDLLMGPDWTMNIEICDSVNSGRWQPKDVVKGVKKRLQHKSSKVQFLALTLLETMVKNCGDFVHFQIAERNVLDEMIKIVRKKTDMQVRDKVLVLLDSWQEAFGGPGGKHPHYYWAYEELRRSGVVFPKRSSESAPIFTPPPTHPTLRHMQAGYGMPSSSSKRLDETMATEIESLSLSSLDSMRHVMELLNDMLQAVNPSDRGAVKDEVIIDLVDRCRTNQKKLMQMLTTTGDEELLGRGLELNDSIQSLLAKHDAIASGSPLPSQYASSSAHSTEASSSSVNPTEVKSSSPRDSSPTTKASPPTPVSSVTKSQFDEEEEEEDEFAQLARRHSKTPKDAINGPSEGSTTMETSNSTSFASDNIASTPANALALVNPAAPVGTSREQDIIDLLSITLSAPSSSPPPSSQQMHDSSVPSSTQGYPYAPQTYHDPSNVPFTSYVVPWAQPESRSESQPQPQQHIYRPQSELPQQQQQQPYHDPQQLQSQPLLQPQISQLQNQHLQYIPPQQQFQSHPEAQHSQSLHQPQPQPQPQQFQSQSRHQPQQFQSQSQPQPLQYQSQSQPQPQQYQSQPQPQPQQFHSQSQTQPVPMMQPQSQSQLQNQHLQYPSSYPPPPWAATPGYFSSQNHSSSPNMFSASQANPTAASYRPAQGIRGFQQNTSGSAVSGGDPRGNSGLGNSTNATGQKPFVPSYRLFEDLNVFGNADGRMKMTSSSTSSSLSGTMGPGMVGGRK